MIVLLYISSYLQPVSLPLRLLFNIHVFHMNRVGAATWLMGDGSGNKKGGMYTRQPSCLVKKVPHHKTV